LKIKIPLINKALEMRFLVSQDPDQAWVSMFGPAVSSGETVNETTAMRLAAVYSCIRVLSESVAQMPLKVFRRLPSGGKQEVADHPIYPLLHLRPDEEVSAFSWKESTMAHLCSWGNAYSFIDFDGSGRPRSIKLLGPDKVTPKRLATNNKLVYEVTDDKGQTKRYLKEQILHIPGLSYDGIIGYSPIRMAAETIGTGISASKHCGAVFGNGARPGGVLSYEGNLNDEQLQRLKASWEAAFSGANVGKTAVLEGGSKYTPITISPADAQLLETMKFNRSEIAGIFRVPAHLINDLEKATFSNIDQLSLEFVMFTLTPWLSRIEQAMNWRLFLPHERGEYFVEFVTDGLLRGDVKSRYEAYRTAINSGLKSINEVRSLENLPPIENGDHHLVQGAMITLDNAVKGINQTGGGETKE
jgi:HK97 family phage portal protein